MNSNKKRKLELIQSLESNQEDSYTTYIKVTIFLIEK